MSHLITQYPITRTQLDQLSSLLGEPLHPFVVSSITARGYRDVLRAFRHIKADTIYLPVLDSSGWPLMPLLQVLSMLAPANRRYLIDVDKNIIPFGILSAARSLAQLVFGSLHAVVRTIVEWQRLRHLLKRPRLAPVDAEINRVAYLKTTLWLGLQAGGSVAHTAGVVKGFLTNGHEVDFFSVESPVALPAHEALRLNPIKPRSTYVVPRELNHYCHNQSFLDQVSPRFGKPGGFIYQRLSLGNFAGVVLSRRHRLPLVVEYNGSELWLANNWGTPLSMKRLAVMAEDACLRHAHLVVTVSKALKDELIGRGLASERIVAFPNGVDTAVFSPERFAKDDILALRRKYSIPADALVITFAGTFGPWHGAEVFAKCIAEMTQTDESGLKTSKLHFMLIGDGIRRHLVEDLTAAADVRRHVTITGLIDQEETPLHLAASDIFVSPHVLNPDGSRFFGSPTKLFEYLATGRPVIGSAIGQIADILNGCPRVEQLDADKTYETGDAVGILVTPNDPGQLQTAINFLATHPDWRNTAGRNARSRALERHTWGKHVEAILAGLRNVQALEDAKAKKPVRVLFNGLHSKTGGGLTYLKNIVPLFARDRDLDVHLCVHRDQQDLLPDNLENISVHYLDFPPGFWRLQVREQIDVPRLARQIGADVTFSPANYGPLMVPNSVVMLRNAMNVAFVERRPMKIAYWGLVYLGTFLSLLTARQAITVSEYAQRNAAVGPIGWLHRQLAVVPHGVSPIFSPPASNTKRDDFLLAVSDIYVQKNFKTLIAAMARLRIKHPEITLKIAGHPVDVDYFAELRRMIAREKLDGRVEFLGRVEPETLVDLYRLCRAFVFPSIIETFGNPLVEAMACGAPIASSNSAAMPEVVGDAAVFFDPLDAADMAAAIDRLLTDPGLRARLSRKAVERAKNYSWQRTAERTRAVIKEAAAR